VNSSALATNFTTESNLEEATEFIFSVRAYTRVGPGNASYLTVATLAAESSTATSYLLYITISSIATVFVLMLSIIVFGYIIRRKKKKVPKIKAHYPLEHINETDSNQVATTIRLETVSVGTHASDEEHKSEEAVMCSKVRLHRDGQ
jgi:hypothetical protein